MKGFIVFLAKKTNCGPGTEQTCSVDMFSSKTQLAISGKSRISQQKVQEAQLPEENTTVTRVLVKILNKTGRRETLMKLLKGDGGGL